MSWMSRWPLSSDFECFSARFSLMDLLAFCDICERGDLSAMAAPGARGSLNESTAAKLRLRALQRGHAHDGHPGLQPRMVQGRQRAPGILEGDHLAHEIAWPQGAVLDQRQHGRVLASSHAVRPVDLE